MIIFAQGNRLHDKYEVNVEIFSTLNEDSDPDGFHYLQHIFSFLGI